MMDDQKKPTRSSAESAADGARHQETPLPAGAGRLASTGPVVEDKAEHKQEVKELPVAATSSRLRTLREELALGTVTK